MKFTNSDDLKDRIERMVTEDRKGRLGKPNSTEMIQITKMWIEKNGVLEDYLTFQGVR